MNWEKPGKSISLPVKIHVSSNPDKGHPIFWLSGGPGMTNLDYNPPIDLLANHDVIEVGFRGVDGSVVLECPEIKKALKGIGKDLLSKGSVDNIIESGKDCAERLKREGVDLNGFTMEQVLKDIDSVRRALKLKKIHLLSGSYGTRLALYYAAHNPDVVESSVMIGGNPPKGFYWDPKIINKKLTDYAAICATDSLCSARTDDLVETFNSVLKNMPKKWLVFNLNPGKIRVVAFGLLYHKNTAIQVIDAFLAADEGDYSGIALMSMAYNFMLPKMMVWGDFLSKGLIDYDSSINYFEKVNQYDYPLGSPFSEMIMDVGSVWPTKQPSQSFTEVEQVFTPTLVLNGDLDFSSPHENVESGLMPLLKNGELMLLKNRGHVNDILYNKEVKKGMANYFMNGEAQFDVPVRKIDFNVKNGFPKITKITVAGGAVLILGFAFGAYLIAK